MTVPFPRTTPPDPPEPPGPLLDHRAARVLFEGQQVEQGARGYRMADEGVYVELPNDALGFFPWEEVRRYAAAYAANDRMAPDQDKEPSRRERRQQRRQERRGDR